MSFIKNIINTRTTTDPWHHQIIDNFLDLDDFSRLRFHCEKIFEKNCLKKGDSLQHPISLIRLKNQIPKDIYYNLWEYNKKILKNCKKILKLYPLHRNFDYHLSIPSFYFMHNSVGFHQIHDETVDKALSIVLYISPDTSAGTRIYRSDNETSFVKEIPWVPNRALVFCGVNSTTWHNFGAYDQDRITLNFFMRETDLVDSNFYVEQNTLYFEKNKKIIKQIPFNEETAELIDLHTKGYLMC
jgi:hypothetical protein